MGIPAFFSWLCQRFPKCVVRAKEVETDDLGEPNPNEVEFDCLYLDMNGLIHNCCHGKDPLPAEGAEGEMIMRIFAAIDEVVSVVRPRKLLYLAVDGVAPKGKLEQQRKRREKERTSASSSWDANAITPGTLFMEKVGAALRWYAYDRCNHDPYYSSLAVVISDSSVPGEGEHKIMHYIRQLRGQEGHAPNLRHCVFGMDADLILLALGTHEPRFTLVRDNRGSRSYIAKQGQSPYSFVHLNTVREYLEADMEVISSKAKEGYCFERCIDDFVVLCTLVGNDFLPALPTLDIKEGALELLFETYRLDFRGYLLMANGKLDPTPLRHLLSVIASKETAVFQKRSQGRREAVPQDVRGWYRSTHGNPSAMDYLRGIQWVASYYLEGTASWTWLYTHDKAPLASDLADALTQAIPADPPGSPPPMLELLLALLPASSRALLPQCYQEDPPPATPSLTREEARRFEEGTPLLFLHSSKASILDASPAPPAKRAKVAGEPSMFSTGDPSTLVVAGDMAVAGCVTPWPLAPALGESYRPEFADFDLDPVEKVSVRCVGLALPPFTRPPKKLPEGYTPPPPTISATDKVMGSESVYKPIA